MDTEGHRCTRIPSSGSNSQVLDMQAKRFDLQIGVSLLFLMLLAPRAVALAAGGGPTTAPAVNLQIQTREPGQDNMETRWQEWVPADVDWQPLPDWAGKAMFGPDGHLWISQARAIFTPGGDARELVAELVQGRSHEVRQIRHGTLLAIDNENRGWVGLPMSDRLGSNRRLLLAGLGDDGYKVVIDVSNLLEKHGHASSVHLPVNPPPLTVGDSIAFNLDAGVLIFVGSERRFAFIQYSHPSDSGADVDFIPVLGSDAILVARSVTAGTRPNTAERVELMVMKDKRLLRASLPAFGREGRKHVTAALQLGETEMLLTTNRGAVRVNFNAGPDLAERLDSLINDLEHADPEVRAAAVEALREDEQFDPGALAEAIKRRGKPLKPEARLQLEALLYQRSGALPGNRIRLGPFSVEHVQRMEQAPDGTIRVSCTDLWQHEPVPDEADAGEPEPPAVDVQRGRDEWPKPLGPAILLCRPDGSFGYEALDPRAAAEAARQEQLRRNARFPGRIELGGRIFDLKLDPHGRLALMQDDEVVHAAPVSGFTHVVARSGEDLVLAPNEGTPLVLYRPLATRTPRLRSEVTSARAATVDADGRPWILLEDGQVQRFGDDGGWESLARVPIPDHRHAHDVVPDYLFAGNEVAVATIHGKTWLATPAGAAKFEDVHAMVEQNRDLLVEAFSGDGRVAHSAGGVWIWGDVDGNLWVRTPRGGLGVYTRPREGKSMWLNVDLHLWAEKVGAVATASSAAPIGDGHAVWVRDGASGEARLLYVKPGGDGAPGSIPEIGVVALARSESAKLWSTTYDLGGRLWSIGKFDIGRSREEPLPYRLSPIPPYFETGQSQQLPPQTRYRMHQFPVGFGTDGTLYLTTRAGSGLADMVSIDPDGQVRLHEIPGIETARVDEMAVLEHSLSGVDGELLLVVPYGILRLQKTDAGALQVAELLACDVGTGTILGTFATDQASYLVLCDLETATFRITRLSGSGGESATD